MKQTITACLMILLATVFAAALPTEAEAEIYEDTIRLHILANSDSDEDQKMKLIIRDKLLAKYGEALRSANNIEEARAEAEELLRDMEEDIELWISDMGCSYSARARICEEWYETREYEGFSMPAGRYLSLIIEIGEGVGANWWCVMYPPLCLDVCCEDMPEDDALIDYSKEESRLIGSGKYNVKFKLLELFSRAFSENG